MSTNGKTLKFWAAELKGFTVSNDLCDTKCKIANLKITSLA